MKKNNISIQEIAHKRQKGIATAEEIEFYDTWYASFDDTDLQLGDGEEDLTAELGASLYARLMVEIVPEQSKKIWFTPYKKWISAAAAVLVLAIGYSLYEINTFDNLFGGAFAKHEKIVPGKATATLKLANGQLIQLKENEDGLVIDSKSLTYTDGSGVAVPKEQALHTQELLLSTPKGGTYQVLLPDGSKVWLNALSSIKLPANFESAFERQVELSGEAYFEIAKSEMNLNGQQKRRPFTVNVGNKKIEVLGTHFNVNSYAEELGVKATLLEGSVKVVTGNNQKLITPGEQALATNQNITTVSADLEQVMAWKNGNFQFSDEKIQRIMLDIGRWYNVEVVYQGAITNETFGGTISRSKPIIEVLASLEETGAVHFKIEGRRVIVMP
ncbi:FecR family protein [Pedobacter sp. SL55]|uniref:FecR family protein n=1 Tax=Pedobacter sp. SL55 TaxID=2995161 RepID=UPI00226F9506|nr:FecR family protein [Pedobacter sp. SL55]WAC41042.1 DUF4974 domain-containing protein [Pedobacter sp. SL55]